jgi:hypothetical protein
MPKEKQEWIAPKLEELLIIKTEGGEIPGPFEDTFFNTDS